MSRGVKAVALGLACALVLCGCWRARRRRAVIAREAIGPAAPAEVVVVPQEPPPLRVEVKPARPHPDHVWVGGYWNWQGGRHVWVAGRWTAPVRRGAVWVPDRWDRAPGGWRRVPGRWR